jgi:hypothetical protein
VICSKTYVAAPEGFNYLRGGSLRVLCFWFLLLSLLVLGAFTEVPHLIFRMNPTLNIAYEPLLDAIEADETAEELQQTSAVAVLNLCSQQRASIAWPIQNNGFDDETFAVNSLIRMHSTDAMDVDDSFSWSNQIDDELDDDVSMDDWDTESPDTPYSSLNIGFDDNLSDSEAHQPSDDSSTWTQLESEVRGLDVASSLFHMSQVPSL